MGEEGSYTIVFEKLNGRYLSIDELLELTFRLLSQPASSTDQDSKTIHEEIYNHINWLWKRRCLFDPVPLERITKVTDKVYQLYNCFIETTIFLELKVEQKEETQAFYLSQKNLPRKGEEELEHYARVFEILKNRQESNSQLLGEISSPFAPYGSGIYYSPVEDKLRKLNPKELIKIWQTINNKIQKLEETEKVFLVGISYFNNIKVCRRFENGIVSEFLTDPIEIYTTSDCRIDISDFRETESNRFIKIGPTLEELAKEFSNA